jgi:hypothetical protein
MKTDAHPFRVELIFYALLYPKRVVPRDYLELPAFGSDGFYPLVLLWFRTVADDFPFTKAIRRLTVMVAMPIFITTIV